MKLGELLKIARHEKKLTQKEIACLLGITREHYAQIETGRFNPSVNLLKAISSKLNLHVTIDFEEGNQVFQPDVKGESKSTDGR